MSEKIYPKVSICICSYKRPEMLAALLRSLVEQQFPSAQMQIVVVDNDEAGSAAQSVADFKKANPNTDILYLVEPVQGIAYARNRTVAHATADLLAFVDDDEEVTSQWLALLCECMAAHNADAVLGPVLARYPRDTPKWVKASGFFERKRFKTGASMTWGDGHTGNALVKGKWLRERKPNPFDVSLAQSGGEDTNFFKWMQSLNGSLIWCDEAEVYEEVAHQRQSLFFILKRSFITSVTYWRPRFVGKSMTWCTYQALVGLARGIALSIYGFMQLPLGLQYSVISWATSAKSFGRMAALTRANVINYGKTE
ncbi:Glyco_tranf_GTA_type domain containing protein [Comamonadaceae bacterium]